MIEKLIFTDKPQTVEMLKNKGELERIINLYAEFIKKLNGGSMQHFCSSNGIRLKSFRNYINKERPDLRRVPGQMPTKTAHRASHREIDMRDFSEDTGIPDPFKLWASRRTYGENERE